MKILDDLLFEKACFEPFEKSKKWRLPWAVVEKAGYGDINNYSYCWKDSVVMCVSS